MPVHDGHQVHEPPGHWDITDVAGPHLVGPCDRHVPEQVGIDLVSLAWRTRAPFRVQRPDPHLTHQTLYALAIDPLAPCIELIADATAAVERKLKVDLVDQAHQREVLFTDR